MTWDFAEAATDSIVGSAYAQWGAIGVLAIGVIVVVTYLYRDNKALRKQNADLQEARLQDIRDLAKTQAQPAEELLKFVRNLYDGFNDTIRRK